MIFGVFGGAYAAHKLLECEQWASVTLEKAVRQKVEANQVRARSPSPGAFGRPSCPWAEAAGEGGHSGRAHRPVLDPQLVIESLR